ncbi:site-2 protease family protein [Candidatus Saccharibacteria bacterium]|jgi:regulator of sigma E protease|nr:site-2 protease family protein [Candidatus Saccharibacteria bacterium]MBP9131731.1 site-2 protease family protein [Candidatus Saccharibacteria bacterium]
MLIAFGIFLFLMLVVVHEYGHFLVAKRNGVEVEEFGVGFPPKIFGKTMGKGIFRSYYTINLLPLGGFVRLKGESSEDKREGSFGASSLKAKAKIAYAGVAANTVLAAILFTIVGLVRMPVIIDNQFSVPSDTKVLKDNVVVTFVGKDSPAEKAGLKNESIILSVAGEKLYDAKDLQPITKKNAGNKVEVIYKTKNDSKQQKTTIKLNEDNKKSQGYLGVATQDQTEQRYTWSAPITGVVLTGQIFKETAVQLFNALSALFAGDTKTAGAGVGGPVLIVYLLSQVESATMIVFIMGTISVALALFNALPLPALDGGRIFVTLLFKLINKPLTEKTENLIHGSGFAVLLVLAALITFGDITKIL